MRFGLKDVNELPSMEEFEKLVAESFQAELMPTESPAQTSEVSDVAAPEAAVSGESSATTQPDISSESAPEIEKAG
jgi:segregation and condensation protein B